MGQYQAVESNNVRLGWEEYNRATGGLEFPFEGRNYTLTGRAAAEYFWYGGRADYTRHRERLLLRLTGIKLQPQIGSESLWDSRGWAGTRALSGMLIPFTPSLTLDAGYYYEFRPARLGGNRHIVYTFFRLRKPRG